MTSIKFGHMADCHLGSWSSHPDMREYPQDAFEKAVDTCIAEGVDFILIAGDLFDTSMPSIDVLRRAAEIFRKCRDNGTPVYIIPGSHDYSPTGKTMLSVFEHAGLLTNVYKPEEKDGKILLKFTTDKKTGAKITGFMGKKGSLETRQFRNIVIPEEQGFKIFMFHAGLSEEKGRPEMLTVSTQDLPAGFDYYASGHIHKQYFDEKMNIAFPGELFPTSFDEMEEYGGSFIIAEYDGRIKVGRKSAKLFGAAVVRVDVTGKTMAEAEKEILGKMGGVGGKIVLIKLSGVLGAGKISDINFSYISDEAMEKGAIAVKKSTSAVSLKEMEEIKVHARSTENIEKSLIAQYANHLKLPGIRDTEDFVRSMMAALKEEKYEDETNATFEERIKSNAKKVVGL